MRRGVYNEDWERQREIITRTLFHDIPLLSPVPEEEDSQIGSFVHASPSSIEAWKPVDNASRPWSPLPPLIIEKEPNRHDEPEEYYEQLARKMRKLHRKLFIENRSLDLIEYSTDETLEESSSVEAQRNTLSVEEHEVTQQTPDSNGSLEEEPSALSYSRADSDNSSSLTDQNTDTNNFNHTQTEHSKKMSNSCNNVDDTANKTLEDKKDSDEESPNLSRTENHVNIARECRSSEKSSNSPGTGHYQQVTFQAEIHMKPGMSDDMSLMDESHVSIEYGGQQRDDALLEKTRLSDTIAKNLSVHLHTRELEVMRTPREPDVHTSFGTPTPHEASSDRVSVEVDRHSLEDNPFDILKDTRISNLAEIDQCSDDFNITLQSSTPKLTNKRRISTENVSDKYTTSSSSKRIRYESVATQCDEMSEWSSLRAKFFVGTPKIFKLCSCKDHRCGC